MVVRSSATAEDGAQDSHAGRYRSLLDVDGASERAVIDAVEHVIASFDGNAADQVLVQPMLTGIAVSGVITTRVVQDGAPYYVLNYDDESGRTDTITGGTGVNKTVLVHRRAIRSVIQSPRVARWVELARELEFVCGEDHPLDIEFAETHDGRLFILQVRRIGAARRWRKDVATRISEAQQYVEGFLEERSRRRPGLVGSRSIFGTMPDWNPAEILGTSPRPPSPSLSIGDSSQTTPGVSREPKWATATREVRLLVQIGAPMASTSETASTRSFREAWMTTSETALSMHGSNGSTLSGASRQGGVRDRLHSG
ncbi:MAG: hypothetical protein IPL90_15385 [Holophagales bacterium]|nr:hypothetical protein [Holophagales bacterium]